MAPQGAFYWNGVQALLQGSFTLQLGVSPGVCTLMIPPQPGRIAMEGTLSLRYGSVAMDFPNCRVLKTDFHMDQSGRKVWMLHIADERWRWRFGIAKGYFNHRLTNGFLEEPSKKTPRELIKLLASACGIKDFDASAVPEKILPFVDWDWRERPDILLSQLCDVLGFRIAYNPKKKVKAVRRGVGAMLPKDNALDYQSAFDPAEIPEKITFVAGPSMWNMDVELEPVGEDLDGKIKPIDDLSYRPALGWRVSDPPAFYCLLRHDDRNNRVFQNAAQQSVFRWYRPKVPFDIDAKRKVQELWQILPLPGYQILPMKNAPDELPRFTLDHFWTFPIWIWGSWLKMHDNNLPTTVNVGDNLIKLRPGVITGGVGVDQERGILQFGQPMHLEGEFGREPAKLWARMALSWRDPQTRAMHHWTKDKKVPGGSKGTMPHYVVREELGWRAGRSIENLKMFGPWLTNEEDLDELADLYLEQELRELQTQTPEVVTLPGFVPFAVDGAIHQVRWWVNEDGRSYTQIARNTEVAPLGGSWAERRFFEETTRLMHEGHRDARRGPA